MSEGTPLVTPLEAALAPAASGETVALRSFYLLLLKEPLFVPERYQGRPMSDAPDYPNDFVNLLGVRDGERSVVPVFPRAEQIEAWCGQRLSYKSLRGVELFKAVPEGWWVCLNPGGDFEKDISPWEIDKLRGGEEQVEELVAELAPIQGEIESVEVRPVEEDDCAGLKRATAAYAENHQGIAALLLLRETGADTDGKQVQKLLLGIEVNDAGMQDLATIRQDLQALAHKSQIGDEEVKVFIGAGRNAVILGAFRGYEPFFERKNRRPIARLKEFLSGFRKS